MGKARTISFMVLLAALGILFGSVEYGRDLIGKEPLVFILFFEGVVILSLSILCGVTFFSLDQSGRIAKNTLAWKYFAKFYTFPVKSADGELASHIEMPEQLKLCPMFYMIVLGIIYASTAAVIILVVGLFIYLSVTLSITIPSDLTWALFFRVLLNALTFLVIVFGLLILFAKICIRLTNEEKWASLASTIALMTLAGFCVLPWALSSGEIPIQWKSISYLDLLSMSALISLVLTAGATLAVTIIAVAFSLLTLCLTKIKNSVFGQLLISLYRGACPMIPFETTNQTEKAAT